MTWFEFFYKVAQFAPLATATGVIICIWALQIIRANDLHSLDERFNNKEAIDATRHTEVMRGVTNLGDRFDSHLAWHAGQGGKERQS